LVSTLPAVVAAAFTPMAASLSRPVASRSAIFKVAMFEDKATEKTRTSDEFVMPSQVTRSREAGMGRTGSIVVTDGSGSFYGSRTVFNQLYDFGGYAKVVASSVSNVDAKKMLISRQSRYSGLSDALVFEEAPTPSFDDVTTWLAIDPDSATLPATVDAATAAGVERIFLLTTTAIEGVEAVEAKLASSGVAFTIMRTGSLVSAVDGVDGLKLDSYDLPVCDDVAKDDVFRFITEALTLPEASGRTFSLCPTAGTSSALKQMRLCGYERRDEVEALLKGLVPDEIEAAAVAELSEEEAQAQKELVMRSEAEVAAEREAELKELLERARARGIENQARMKFEEAERLAHRKEQEKYYKAPLPADDSDSPADTPEAPEDKEATRDSEPKSE